MDYKVRHAARDDLRRIEEVYAYARQFMADNGNPRQWGKNHPPKSQIEQDIAQGNLYVITEAEKIHGVFYFWIGEDPTYDNIYDGAWRSDSPYGTIHRIAGDGCGGILRTAVGFGKRHIDHLRIDTHEDNKVMQKAVTKQGFQRCGIIYIEDGSPRIAYELLSEECMIREAVFEDLDEILNLYLYLHETDIPEDSTHLRNTWSQIITDPNYHLIVCEVDGKIVASCVCVIIPNLTRNVRPYAFVENVVTHKDHRGRGYATACLNHAKRIAQEAHCYKMMLLTGSKDRKTLDFYRNAGYNSADKTAFIQWLDR